MRTKLSLYFCLEPGVLADRLVVVFLRLSFFHSETDLRIRTQSMTSLPPFPPPLAPLHAESPIPHILVMQRQHPQQQRNGKGLRQSAGGGGGGGGSGVGGRGGAGAHVMYGRDRAAVVLKRERVEASGYERERAEGYDREHAVDYDRERAAEYEREHAEGYKRERGDGGYERSHQGQVSPRTNQPYDVC